MTSFVNRPAMVPVSRSVRAYFAPVDRVTNTPSIFDPGKYGLFQLDSPPAPWLDLGWIENFRRVSLTSTEALRSGIRAAAAGQFRGILDGRVEFDFREWGKLQMAFAAGSEHMNVLAPDPNAAAQASGGTPIAAVAVLPGSSPCEIVVGAASVNGFSEGDIIAVDADYQQETGYVGNGISGAYVTNPTDVHRDLDYIRRVTFNVGRVAQITATSLLLAQPLLAGAPEAGWGVQRVLAFLDREGGSFFQEWSALFVAEEESGGRICFHYPRLQPVSSLAGSSEQQPEHVTQLTAPISTIALHASFMAMPYTDENDGQTAVCYRTYFPAALAALY